MQIFETLEEALSAARASKENLEKRILEHRERQTKKLLLDKLNNS